MRPACPTWLPQNRSEETGGNKGQTVLYYPHENGHSEGRGRLKVAATPSVDIQRQPTFEGSICPAIPSQSNLIQPKCKVMREAHEHCSQKTRSVVAHGWPSRAGRAQRGGPRRPQISSTRTSPPCAHRPQQAATHTENSTESNQIQATPTYGVWQKSIRSIPSQTTAPPTADQRIQPNPSSSGQILTSPHLATRLLQRITLTDYRQRHHFFITHYHHRETEALPASVRRAAPPPGSQTLSPP
jgi:hypothetical protein